MDRVRPGVFEPALPAIAGLGLDIRFREGKRTFSGFLSRAFRRFDVRTELRSLCLYPRPVVAVPGAIGIRSLSRCLVSSATVVGDFLVEESSDFPHSKRFSYLPDPPPPFSQFRL